MNSRVNRAVNGSINSNSVQNSLLQQKLTNAEKLINMLTNTLEAANQKIKEQHELLENALPSEELACKVMCLAEKYTTLYHTWVNLGRDTTASFQDIKEPSVDASSNQVDNITQQMTINQLEHVCSEEKKLVTALKENINKLQLAVSIYKNTASENLEKLRDLQYNQESLVIDSELSDDESDTGDQNFGSVLLESIQEQELVLPSLPDVSTTDSITLSVSSSPLTRQQNMFFNNNRAINATEESKRHIRDSFDA